MSLELQIRRAMNQIMASPTVTDADGMRRARIVDVEVELNRVVHIQDLGNCWEMYGQRHNVNRALAIMRKVAWFEDDGGYEANGLVGRFFNPFRP